MKKYLIALLLVVSTLCITSCGRTNNELMESMYNHTANKYNNFELEIKNFQAARDASYTNILSLSDGTHIFNVYQNENEEPSDDYLQVILNKKLLDSINIDASRFKLYGNFLLTGDKDLDMRYAKESDVSMVLNDYTILKSIMVVKTDKPIAECSDELYNIYKQTTAFNPEYIEFVVIQIENTSEKLENMLTNISSFYDNNWNKFSEIKDYLVIEDTNIPSQEVFKETIK